MTDDTWTGEERRSGRDRRLDDRPPESGNRRAVIGRRKEDLMRAVTDDDDARRAAGDLVADTASPPRRRTADTWRRRVYRVITVGDRKDLMSRVFDIALVTLITLNVGAVVLESVEEIERAYRPLFYVFELVSVGVFTLEYLARLWVIVEDPAYAHPIWGRLRYMVSPMALIDLLAVAPFYFHVMVGADLRFLRVLRLLRIFKLTRYSSAMNILLTVLRQEAQAFGAALFVLALLMIFSASLVWLFEHQAQPESFGNIPKAMWWAVVTLTTVGYGDLYPITPLGKLFGAAISVVGIGMVALPAGILASAFSEQLHLRRQKYEDQVDDALADGRLTTGEIERLKELRRQLGLSEEEAREIVVHAVRDSLRVEVCPHCGKPLEAPANGGKTRGS